MPIRGSNTWRRRMMSHDRKHVCGWYTCDFMCRDIDHIPVRNRREVDRAESKERDEC